jgi:hypothetical protein
MICQFPKCETKLRSGKKPYPPKKYQKLGMNESNHGKFCDVHERLLWSHDIAHIGKCFYTGKNYKRKVDEKQLLKLKSIEQEIDLLSSIGGKTYV